VAAQVVASRAVLSSTELVSYNADEYPLFANKNGYVIFTITYGPDTLGTQQTEVG
jgi:hypothetical protein